jgi:hypothetical protein
MLSILKFGNCPGSLVYRSNDNKPVLVSVQWEPHRQATLSLEHLEGKNNKDYSQKLFKPVNQAHFAPVSAKDAKGQTFQRKSLKKLCFISIKRS